MPQFMNPAWISYISPNQQLLEIAEFSSYGTRVVSNQMVLPCTSAYTRAYTGGIFNLTSSSAAVKVIQVPPTGNGTTEAELLLQYDDNNYFMFGWSGGGYFASLMQAGTPTNFFGLATNTYWRIREAAGTVFFETSANFSTWATQTSSAHTLGTMIQAMRVLLQCGFYGTETSPGPFIVAGVNVT